MELDSENIKACFKRAKKHLEKASKNWEANKKLMMGFGPSPMVKKENRIAEAYGLFRELVSQTMAQLPEVYFEGITEAGRMAAKLMTDATNYDFKIGKLHNKIIRALWRNFPYGFGLIAEDRINYKAKLEDSEDEIIKEQNFFWRSVPNRDALFDPDGIETTFEDHRFMFLAYYNSVANIRAEAKGKKKEDGYFDIDDIETMPPTSQAQMNLNKMKYFQEEGAIATDTDLSEDYKQLKLWRMYDRMSETCYDILDFDERHVKTEPWPDQVKIQGDLQFPVKMIALNADTDGFYPVPELDLIRSQLVNLMRLNDIFVTDMTTKLRKYAGLASYMSKDKLSKFVDISQPNSVLLLGEDQTLAENANVTKIDSAQDAIFKLPDIQVDPNIVAAMNEERNQIARITGLSVVQQGGPAPRSAREAQRQNDMIQRRMSTRLAPLEQATSDMAIYHMMLVKRSGTDLIKRYYRVSDAASGLQMWKEYVPSDIPNEQDIFCDVYTGSSTPKTLDAKREQTLKEMSIMSPILQQNGYSLLPILYKWADVFQVRGFDQLLKNPKGKAMEALAALFMAGKKGKQMNPGTLMTTMKSLIDAVLSPAEEQSVMQAMENSMGDGNGAGPPGQANAPKPAGMTADLKSPQDVQ